MVDPLLPLTALIVWAMGLFSLGLPAPSLCAMATIRALLLPHHSFHKSEQSGAFLETETRGGKKKPQLVIQESPLLLLLLSSPHAGQPNSLPNFLGRAYHFPPPNF